MAVTYGFFDALQNDDGSYDRIYNADQMSDYFKGLVSDGVYADVGDGLQVVASSGMQVQVKPGRALIDCKWFQNTAMINVDISPSHVTLNRYTAVALRLDYNARMITLVTKDGDPAATPKKPEMTRSQAVRELCLAYIYIGNGATAISQANIEDCRADGTVCGWVSGLIRQVDTSQLFLQFQTAYEEQLKTMETWQEEQKSKFENWMSTLTGELQVNTYIEQKRTSKETTEDTSSVTLDAGFDETKDLLFVYLNGMLLDPATDYRLTTVVNTLQNKQTTYVRFNNMVEAGNTLDIRILKSKIGQA